MFRASIGGTNESALAVWFGWSWPEVVFLSPQFNFGCDSDRKCRPDDHYHIYTIHQHSRMVIVCTGLRCLRHSAHLHFQGPPREAFLYFRNFKEPAYDPVTVSSGEAAIFHKRCPIGCPLLAILLELGLLLLLRVPDRLYETRLNCAQFEL